MIENTRENMYGFIEHTMDRIGIKCPPLEVFEDKVLERWFNSYVVINNILDEQNDEHNDLLCKAGIY